MRPLSYRDRLLHFFCKRRREIKETFENNYASCCGWSWVDVGIFSGTLKAETLQTRVYINFYFQTFSLHLEWFTSRHDKANSKPPIETHVVDWLACIKTLHKFSYTCSWGFPTFCIWLGRVAFRELSPHCITLYFASARKISESELEEIFSFDWWLVGRGNSSETLATTKLVYGENISIWFLFRISVRDWTVWWGSCSTQTKR